MAPNGLIALTESGYLMIAKVFDDDLAWEVQRSLVNSYFRLKDVVGAAVPKEKDIFREIAILKSGMNKLYQYMQITNKKQSDKLDHITSILEKSNAIRQNAGLESWRNRVMNVVHSICNISGLDEKKVLSKAYRDIAVHYEPRINDLHKQHKELVGHDTSMLNSLYWMEAEHMVEPELLLNVLRIILCQIAEEC